MIDSSLDFPSSAGIERSSGASSFVDVEATRASGFSKKRKTKTASRIMIPMQKMKPNCCVRDPIEEKVG